MLLYREAEQAHNKIQWYNENKYVAVHMTTGEIAVMCCQVGNGGEIISSLTLSIKSP